MKLVSLAQKYDETSKPYGTDTDEYYPSVYLDEKHIEAMGIDAARVGTDMTMVSTVRISSASESKNGHRSMSFEIIEAKMMPKEPETDASSVIFPNG